MIVIASKPGKAEAAKAARPDAGEIKGSSAPKKAPVKRKAK